MKLENVTCFLPIEVKARELDTKVFLALRLVEKGFSVAVGSKIAIHKHMLLSKNLLFILAKVSIHLNGICIIQLSFQMD